MNFGDNYRKARDNVISALGLSHFQAREWLVTHAGITVTGMGIYTKIYGDEKANRKIAKLAGVHGVTLVKMINIQRN